MINQLDSLKKNTIIVADTIDVRVIKFYKPQSITTNPSLILQSIQMLEYKKAINDAIKWAKNQSCSFDQKVIDACDKLVVNIGLEILKLIPGRISTEIDANISYDTDACIKKAHRIIELYNESGIHNNRILIKIPATWQGISAAKALEKEGINCNLTLLFSFAQARLCAESGVYLISPFVGRILDWFNKMNISKKFSFKINPGVIFVKKIFKYYKKFGYNTFIMGASFRSISEILELSGCDFLTISPSFLKKLFETSGEVKNNLKINKFYNKISTHFLNESEFYWKHNFNSMASYMLSDGIKKFSIDQEKLKKFCSSMLSI